MRNLIPFIKLFKYAKFRLTLGIILMILALLMSISLLMLSGWFLAAAALSGTLLFNFFYPSAGVRGLAIFRTFFRYLEHNVTHDATFALLAKLRTFVFDRIIPLNGKSLAKFRQSDLLSRLVSDVDTLDTLYLRLIAPFISTSVVILLVFCGLSFINFKLALFLAIFLFALMILLPLIFYRLGMKFGEKLTENKANYRSSLLEWASLQAEVLLFCNNTNEDKLRKNLDETQNIWQQEQQREANLSGVSSAITLFFNGLLILTVLMFATQVEWGDDITSYAKIAIFCFCAMASFELVMPLGGAFLHLGQIIASAKRITAIIDANADIEFGSKTFNFDPSQQKQDIIRFDQVDFSYDNPEIVANKVLNKLTFEIKQGEKVAILGKTGSGKSTIFQLLTLSQKANSGNILLANSQNNSVEYAELSSYSEDSIRKNFAVLTQRVHVFSASLRDNLNLAERDDYKISDEKMIKVLNQVGLSALLDKSVDSAENLDMWLGDGGRALSGGEIRRLGVARLLLSDAKILLLDEPTEGLDRTTEQEILRLLLDYARDKTLIMITHRLSQLNHFDNLLIIDEGSLIEQGTSKQLLSKQGMFYNLANRLQIK